jgi:hypothetical protein
MLKFTEPIEILNRDFTVTDYTTVKLCIQTLQKCRADVQEIPIIRFATYTQPNYSGTIHKNSPHF